MTIQLENAFFILRIKHKNFRCMVYDDCLVYTVREGYAKKEAEEIQKVIKTYNLPLEVEKREGDVLFQDTVTVKPKKYMKKIYLCIPYSAFPSLSFDIANKIAARLMSEGNIVFSPISHSHPIATYLPEELRTDSVWWMQQDLPMVEWADEVHVVLIGKEGHQLVMESKGCQSEIRFSDSIKKPIKYINYEHV